MNSMFSSSTLACLPSLYNNPKPYKQLPHFSFTNHRLSSLSIQSTSTSRKSTVCAVPPSEGTVSIINFEDFVEKDWSFLDADDISTDEAFKQNIDRIISAGKVGDDSKILISTGSEQFVDRVVDTCSCKLLLVVHDSLFTLACIKEKYDTVKCWQGEMIYVPEKWAPFDVVFLYFLPALPFELDQVFGALSKVCSQGARIVISHPKGREMLEKQKAEYPDVVVSGLPDKPTLESVASHNSFTMVDFVDQPDFYIAVLEHTK
ncbi:putative S-adenosyl-L-methionine-dependent methyltransferase [Helianthus annuus]|nr:putative S-adenosyl-L-methionine-dependent methyltransferase [Helianthus annuus]